MNMESFIPPKVLVRTWLQLIKTDYLPPEQKALIEKNIYLIQKTFPIQEISKNYPLKTNPL